MRIIEEKDLDRYLAIKNIDLDLIMAYRHMLNQVNRMFGVNPDFLRDEDGSDLVNYIEDRLKSLYTEVEPADEEMLQFQEKVNSKSYKELIADISKRNQELEKATSRVRTI